ncbi:hypothetical protein HDU83_006818 [Entophlyctis luteolus]|nr:hypothetical protein HDU83_006818 [Entophlyctis luteolus]
MLRSNNQQVSHDTFSEFLPETPSTRKPARSARPNESLVSANGSPIRPFYQHDDYDDADASMVSNCSIARISIKPRMALNDNKWPAEAFCFEIPLKGGNNRVELDTVQSPTAIRNLDETARIEIRDKMKQMQEQLSALLNQIQ